MLPVRIGELVNALLDGEASAQDVAELQSLTADDAELASQLADLIVEHRLLGLIHQPFDAEMFADSVMNAIAQEERSAADAIIDKIHESGTDIRGVATNRVGSRRSRFKYASGIFAAVAMSLAFVTGGWLYLTFISDQVGTSVPVADSTFVNASIATLLLEENCFWRTDSVLDEGERLEAGLIELAKGTAVLRFDGGAELVMVGPVAVNLKSAACVHVHHGDVVIRANEGADGFVVLTPTSEVVDLGTEFAVKVKHDGKTEVHVLEGEVTYRKIDAPHELVKILRAGQSVAIGKNGQPVAVPMNSPRFKDYLRKINPRSRTDLLSAYEGFNYSPGILPLEKSSVGIGWAGPWRRRTARERTLPSEDTSPSHFEIVHGRMNVTWPVPGGRLGMLKLPAGNSYYLRPLKKSIDLDGDGVTFFSLMVRETTRPTRTGKRRERLRLTVRSLSNYYADYISFGHHSGYQPQVRTGNGVLHSSPVIIPVEQTTLWIGKIVSRAQGEDEISFHIFIEDDVLGYAEPATWHVVTRNFESNSRFDCLLLSSEGTTERIVDEIRIGPTWRSVAPMTE